MTDHQLTGHGGTLAVEAARAQGVQTMFTLSGGHVFPLYDGAVHAEPPMQIVDVRHEQTAVFAAEATAKLTRRPGFAVLTAGPGVTNAVSAVTTAHFNGSPVLVLGGRAPDSRWGQGGLQELDHPPMLAPVTKRAATIPSTDRIAGEVDAALALAASPHPGPVFLDVAMDTLFGQAEVSLTASTPEREGPDPADVAAAADVLRSAERPVLVLGSDVWTGGADEAARRCAQELGLPVVANGMARGVLAPSEAGLVTRARSVAFKEADTVVVVGTPLDFRLGFGTFGDPAGPARVVHIVDAADQLAGHVPLAAGVAGDLTCSLDDLVSAIQDRGGPGRDWPDWLDRLGAAAREARQGDAEVLESGEVPIHPARLYGELRRCLDDDAVVIGDGGDFVSYAGKYLEPARPGGWLDPGPYGCLGTGLGYAVAARLARPASQVVCLLGDGAAGFSLMDVDTLVRHRLPVVMVCGNNGIWGLEKHPMRFLYGYDVAADLAPGRRYDEVVRALGGDGETVTHPAEIAPALRRGFGAGTPYLINLITDPEIAYPRSTTGV